MILYVVRQMRKRIALRRAPLMALAVTLAGLKKLRAEGKVRGGETVVLLLTGHTLKDADYTIDFHRGTLLKDEEKSGREAEIEALRRDARVVEATPEAVLATLIKQRKESVEQFTKGGRQEMADKESAEIALIETYLPKAAGEADIAAGVKAVIAEMGAPTMKDMGTVMKNVMARFQGADMRVDGKIVSEMVKKELAGK